MTDSIKSALVSFAVYSAVGGILEYLVPQKYKRTLRTVVTAVVIVICLSPFVGGFAELPEEFATGISDEQIAYDALQHTAGATERKIRDEVKAVLINLGIDEYEIYVSTSCDKDENIVYLEEIKIEVAEEFEYLLSGIAEALPQEYKSVLKTGVKNE